MGAFQVTPEELGDLASRLSSLLGQLDQATTGMQTGDVGAAGASQLAQALEDFLSGWSSGLHDLRNALDTLASRLGGAARSYETTEQNIAGRFAGS